MKTPNIFFVNPHNGIRGGNKIVFEYCNYLAARFQRCFVICDDGVPNWMGINAYFMNRDTAQALANPDDFVIFHWDHDADYAMKFPAENKFYLIQHFVHLDHSIFKIPINFISVSNYIQKHTKERYGVVSTVVMNCIDHAIFYPRNTARDKRRIFAIDRGGFKGVRDIRRAEILVKRSIPDAQFIYKNNLSPNEMAEEYSRSEIFVSASWYEGFGLPVLEAMACGAAVVTTDSKGIDDFAFHEKNCLKVPPRDPVVIADAIITLLEDGEKRSSLCREGISTARRFNWETSIDVLAKLLGLTANRSATKLFSSLSAIGILTTVMDRTKEPYGRQLKIRKRPIAMIERFKGGAMAISLLKLFGFEETVRSGDFDYNKVNFVEKEGDKSYINCKEGAHILYVPNFPGEND